ncbi:hypothetical protein chiPu_0002677 [Chiloscyllium punctatum]|uniref:Uncharacterized protein n=1 Tax=Chiloscyllium punctatum TaxID=137246 RepID=A0A401S1M4_CHIPU|nr:hypothetical protein [Chiloscyllium punctatum]
MIPSAASQNTASTMHHSKAWEFPTSVIGEVEATDPGRPAGIDSYPVDDLLVARSSLSDCKIDTTVRLNALHSLGYVVPPHKVHQAYQGSDDPPEGDCRTWGYHPDKELEPKETGTQVERTISGAANHPHDCEGARPTTEDPQN